MKPILSLFTLLVLVCGCKNETTNSSEEINTETQQNEFAIIFHGGEGTVLKENMSDELEAEYKEKLQEAVKVGYTILKNVGTSQDAVLKTIQVTEESPLFNAGKGAVFTNEGTNELNASFMDGKTLNAGRYRSGSF